MLTRTTTKRPCCPKQRARLTQGQWRHLRSGAYVRGMILSLFFHFTFLHFTFFHFYFQIMESWDGIPLLYIACFNALFMGNAFFKIMGIWESLTACFIHIFGKLEIFQLHACKFQLKCILKVFYRMAHCIIYFIFPLFMGNWRFPIACFTTCFSISCLYGITLYLLNLSFHWYAFKEGNSWYFLLHVSYTQLLILFFYHNESVLFTWTNNVCHTTYWRIAFSYCGLFYRFNLWPQYACVYFLPSSPTWHNDCTSTGTWSNTYHDACVIQSINSWSWFFLNYACVLDIQFVQITFVLLRLHSNVLNQAKMLIL